MKTRFAYLAIGALLALTLVFGAVALTAQSASAGKQQWEYMTIDWLGATTKSSYDDVGALRINDVDTPPGAPQKLTDVLNEYGAQGWELVGVETRDVPLSQTEFNNLNRYILKRAVS